MTEKDASSAAAAKKGKSATKARKPKTAPSHPKVSEMVNTAIKSLKERSGSSLQAIKKYIASNYKVDVEKLSPFIKKYLKTAVASGGLVQTKGKGVSGSFRMSSTAASGAAKSASKAKKSAAKPKTPKAASTPKKTSKPKKTPQKSKPKKATPAKKSKPVAKTAAKKAKPAKTAAKKKPAKATPKKKAASKKGRK